MIKAIINANIFDFNNYKTDQYIIFDKKIIEIGSMKSYSNIKKKFDIQETIEAKGKLVMPGLTACHVHIYSTFARGLNLEFNPKSFQDILDQFWWKIDSNLDKEAVYYSGLVSGLEYVKNGVTTIIDHHASGMNIKGSLDALKESICEKIGLRGIFCFESSDRFPIDECIKENIDFSKNKTSKSAGMFGMHASLSICEESIIKIAKSNMDLPIHIHVAESKEDEDDSMNRYGIRVVERLNNHGLLKKDSLLAHCVHINENEAKLIKNNGCYVVMNTMSNMNNAVGLLDYRFLKKHGIKVLLGNDGLGYNFARDILNFFFAMKHIGNSPNAIGLDDLLDVIKNGYEYTGKLLGIKIGKIEEDFVSDLLLVDYNPPTPMDEKNALGHLIFGLFDNFRPRHVIVDGKFVQRDYISNINVEETMEKSRQVSRKVWDRMNGEGNRS